MVLRRWPTVSQHDADKAMIKGFRQIASLTAISRVFGLVRDITYCHFFGASGLLDAWIIAFRIPNL
ncbi:MAG: hypothetical protein ACYSX1_02655, partial [Planctomycetota bacterium]